MATIKDVARLAEVSVATVSRVLNNSGYVTDKTKNKINLAIKNLNYTPNQLARGLVSQKTNTIGLLLPDITNPYFPELTRGIEDAAQKKGYSMILCNTDQNTKKERDYINLLLEKCVDGIIIIGEIAEFNMEILLDKKIPIILNDTRMENSDVPYVYTDNVFGGKLATKHLFEQGYTNIGHIRGPVGVASADDRFEGYLQALDESGLAYDSVIVQEGNYKINSGFNSMQRLLNLSKPPDSVFVANDLMAFGAIKAIREANIEIPQDIGIVGYDGIALTEIIHPKLTTIQQPFYKSGVLVTNKLVEMIIQKNSDTENTILIPELKMGSTSLRRNS